MSSNKSSEELAEQDYARVRGSVREPDEPIPHWDDLSKQQQEMLAVMWLLGAQWAAAKAGHTLQFED